jgi:hypothetical protein
MKKETRLDQHEYFLRLINDNSSIKRINRRSFIAIGETVLQIFFFLREKNSTNDIILP